MLMTTTATTIPSFITLKMELARLASVGDYTGAAKVCAALSTHPELSAESRDLYWSKYEYYLGVI